ncbi:hypothetical protein SeMB42_g01516 [Synchytrium endobioticum]|uniref:Uncharacterized protein n=1 Tax=Synchytrium endobioticum TaxID=286115 RepID=A0A507DKT6_9FUNG|nr:hypothetical protein SeMB42_g01516 [Synchytrium endobioticum]
MDFVADDDHDMEHADAVADHGRHHIQNHAGPRGGSRRNMLGSDLQHSTYLCKSLKNILTQTPNSAHYNMQREAFWNTGTFPTLYIPHNPKTTSTTLRGSL